MQKNPLNKKIPMVLVTGFLGSGKTTFINWLLEKHRDKKISIILNEFGDIKLESQFISQPAEGVIELANGCMCCVAKSDIPRTIAYILEHSPQTECIVIEASGLSDPDPVREALQLSSQQTPTYLEATICIVDAVHFEQMAPEHPIITSQIGDADLVVVSKVGESTQQDLEQLVNRLHGMTPDVRVLLFNDDLSPDIFLTDIALGSSRNIEGEHHHHHHLHQQYQVFVYKPDRLLHFQQVSALCQSLPSTIIRIKGVFTTKIDDEIINVLIQRVGSHFTVAEAEQTIAETDQPLSPQSPSQNSNAIVFIGSDFDQIELEKKLDTCLLD